MTHSVNPRRTHSTICTLSYVHTHTNARARKHTVTRRHVWWGGTRYLTEEGLLIKAHQGRPFTTGGRVVQEHRDTTAAVRQSRQSEGDGLELLQLEDTDRQRHGEKTPDPDSAIASFLSAVGLNPSRSASNTKITPRHELLLLNVIDAELSCPVLSSSVSPTLRFLSLCLSPGF